MIINAVLVAVVIMLGLSLARVHVVLSLLIGAMAGGLLAGLGITDTLNAFQEGIRNGAQIALSYALLGAFAVAIAHSGLPQSLAGAVIKRIDAGGTSAKIKYMLFAALVMMSCFSQNLIPIHIAFIPLLVPPLLLAFNRMQIDRRLIACLITFGLVTTYMFIPYGFGDIYLNQIMLKNVGEAGIDISDISVTKAMAIPALGMFTGLLVAVFISYRKPRQYKQLAIDKENRDTIVKGKSLEGDTLSKTATEAQKQSKLKTLVALAAIVTAFVVQLYTDSLLLGSMFGFGVFMATGVVKWRDADTVFNDGIKLMAMIGFIMITAQGFAEVMKATEQIQPLVDGATNLFAGNKAVAAFVMLSLGFSPLATVAIIGTAGALGDAGSPASDSTLGPTSGLNIDGQHDHIRDSVVPTFLHYNIPLLAFGWIAAMVL